MPLHYTMWNAQVHEHSSSNYVVALHHVEFKVETLEFQLDYNQHAYTNDETFATKNKETKLRARQIYIEAHIMDQNQQLSQLGNLSGIETTYYRIKLKAVVTSHVMALDDIMPKMLRLHFVIVFLKFPLNH